MKNSIKQAALAGAALALVSGPSIAKDPLVGGSIGAAVIADKDLANVRGSGSTTQLYTYYGAYYGSYASLYGAYGQYYNYYQGTGSGSNAANNLYYAQYYAYYSYIYYNSAYASALNGT